MSSRRTDAVIANEPCRGDAEPSPWHKKQSLFIMKIYELILIQEGVERSLGELYKDEQKARAEMHTQNLRCGKENEIYPPYQVRERKVL